ncbi:hypothetical protein [Natronolimnohabitans innermongolicus]|uniref:Uncharacterized protein n=1 Tax=Natronolimnohabitans innermongolicus JCM 12255 TaxID=1227499 RepID=L9WJT7_9EURY|nr:hypothetical protein [Natronolimnohabitans innermongolicus]ELY49642.1 hypothetical protein C493_20135 [Natronolimnohabitans innermongolicus JCM 12255]
MNPIDSLFHFEREKIPLPVALATGTLIALFAVGVPYRVLVGF